MLPLPAQGQSNEQSLETGVIHNLLENDQKKWEQILSEQLTRRDNQIAIEKARQNEIELAKRAEQARLAQIPKSVQKVAQTAPKHVIQAVSHANSYVVGQCVFYVASRRSVPSNWGNANQWLANARAAGWATGNVPRVGAIAWTGAGPFGHVAIVEAVNDNQVTVSDMNYAGVGIVTTRLTSASEWGGFIY